MKTIRQAMLILLTAAALSTPAFAQVTVPNTFTAGTPARAADVNANFSALATAINSLNSQSYVSGYSEPWASSDALASRNVLIVKSTDPANGNITYQLRMRYTNTSGEQIPLGGVPTTFTYIARYVTVNTDNIGTILNVSESIDAMNSTAYTDYYTTFRNLNPTDLSPISPFMDARHIVVTCDPPGASVGRCLNETTDTATANPAPYTVSNNINTRLALGHSVTFNNMTFTNVVVQIRDSNNSIQYRAQGVGTIMIQNILNGVNQPMMTAIYHREGGAPAAGSLANTPFIVTPLAGWFFF